MLTEPRISFIESRLTVAELEWPCMTAQSRGCLAIHAIQPRLVWSPSIHYFHLLVQHGAQFPECCSRNQILKRQISTELSIITLLLHLISFLQYLHIYPSHITLPYQSACASRSGTIWLPIRWCHILCTTCNANLILRMLMNAKSLVPFPGANNPSQGGLLGMKAQFIQNSFQVMKY